MNYSSRHIKPYITLFITIVFLCNLSADVLMVTNCGNTPVPVKEEDIAMEAEEVKIYPAVQEYEKGGTFIHGYEVDCIFKMKSYSDKTIKGKMAFPIHHPQYGRLEFKASIQDSNKVFQPVKVETKMAKDHCDYSWAEYFYWQPPHDSFNYPGFRYWDVTFKPHETKIIKCAYDMGESEIFWVPPFEGISLQYIVRTGALWKGCIKDAKISISFGCNENKKSCIAKAYKYKKSGKYEIQITYPRNAKWIDDKTIEWNFKNWKPDKDIQLSFVKWVGFNFKKPCDWHYRLPHPYRADKTTYEDEFLQKLVQNEKKKWDRFFPEKVKELDDSKLKSLIAFFLYNEIFARHGDRFSDEEPENCDYGNSLKSYFMRYSYHGGWYRPKTDKVPYNDLTEIEKKNVLFLRKYLNNPAIGVDYSSRKIGRVIIPIPPSERKNQ